jgi:O-antigen/teichoic acid export membrane protein
VFVLIFGREWQLAGTYAAILAPWTAAMIANLLSVSVLPILGKQRFALGFDVIVFLGRVLALACGALLGSHIAAIAAYSGVGLALNAALILIVFEFARRHTAGGATVALNSAGVRYA